MVVSTFVEVTVCAGPAGIVFVLKIVVGTSFVDVTVVAGFVIVDTFDTVVVRSGPCTVVVLYTVYAQRAESQHILTSNNARR